MNNHFNDAVRNAIDMGKNLICVSDPDDIADSYNAKDFVSLKNYEDIADAQMLLGLGTDDFIYFGSVWCNKCFIFDLDGQWFDIGQQISASNGSSRPRTKEFEAFWEEVNNNPKKEASKVIDKFIKDFEGSMILVFDIEALDEWSGNKEDWRKTLHKMAEKYNANIYREELYN